MFGLSTPVHLEINKLLLEIPFVSELGTKDPAGRQYSWQSAFLAVGHWGRWCVG